MLADHTPTATVATADLGRARSFYEDTLGFTVEWESEDAGAVTYKGGGGHLTLYASEFAGSNKATAVGFSLPIEAFNAEVSRLRSAGITFDTFDVPGLTWDVEGVAVMGQGKAFWFRDPDGNIIAVMTGSMG